MLELSQLPDFTKLTPDESARLVIDLIKQHIPHSSTKLSLDSAGYPENGKIERTIRTYQSREPGLKSGYFALLTGCGNCQDMAYAAALILRAGGYKGKLAIGQFGLNHRFLVMNDMIIDGWSADFYPQANWRDHIVAYGGSIKDGIMRGRLLLPTHFELEDEVPEEVEQIPMDIQQLLIDCEKIELNSSNYPSFFTANKIQDEDKDLNFHKKDLGV